MSNSYFSIIQRVYAKRSTTRISITTERCCRRSLVRHNSIPLILHSFLAHTRPEALLQATIATLIPLVLVNHTVLLEATRVHVTFAHTSSEEALAAVARVGAVMFSGGTVTTYGAYESNRRASRRVVASRRVAQVCKRLSGRGGRGGQRGLVYSVRRVKQITAIGAAIAVLVHGRHGSLVTQFTTRSLFLTHLR